MRFTCRWHSVGLIFMSFFFLLFFFASLSWKLFHRIPLTTGDSYLVILNNLALSVAALYIFGYSLNRHDVAIISAGLSVFAALQAILIHNSWPDEEQVKRMLASLA